MLCVGDICAKERRFVMKNIKTSMPNFTQVQAKPKFTVDGFD